MTNEDWFTPIEIKVIQAVETLIETKKAKSAKDIARRAGLDSNVFAQLNAMRSHIKPEGIQALIHTFKLNPGYFFYEDVSLFMDDFHQEMFEGHDKTLQVNHNKGQVGNVIHTFHGNIQGDINSAKKIFNELPPDCRKDRCKSIFSDLKKGLTYFKKKCDEKDKQLNEAMHNLKLINQEAHEFKNKYIEVNDKHIQLMEKYTKLLEDKTK